MNCILTPFLPDFIITPQFKVDTKNDCLLRLGTCIPRFKYGYSFGVSIAVKFQGKDLIPQVNGATLFLAPTLTMLAAFGSSVVQLLSTLCRHH